MLISYSYLSVTIIHRCGVFMIFTAVHLMLCSNLFLFLVTLTRSPRHASSLYGTISKLVVTDRQMWYVCVSLQLLSSKLAFLPNIWLRLQWQLFLLPFALWIPKYHLIKNILNRYWTTLYYFIIEYCYSNYK